MEQPGALAPPMIQPTTSMSLARALSTSAGSNLSKEVSNTFFTNSATILIGLPRFDPIHYHLWFHPPVLLTFTSKLLKARLMPILEDRLLTT
jgi:hypothetical protein